MSNFNWACRKHKTRAGGDNDFGLWPTRMNDELVNYWVRQVLKSSRGMKAHLVLQYWRSVMVPNDHAPQTCSSKLLEIKKTIARTWFCYSPKVGKTYVSTASFPTPVALDSTTGHMPTVRWKHTKLAICIAWISSTFHQEQIPTVQ